jgi:hypothetical protein
MLVLITFTGLPPASAGFLLRLLFHPEDEGEKFLRNVWLSRTTGHYNPEGRHCHVNLITNLFVQLAAENFVEILLLATSTKRSVFTPAIRE